MAKREAPVQRAEAKRTGLIRWQIKFLFTLLWIVVVSILTSIVIEWMGIYFEWFSQPGAEHARQTMITEMGWLDGWLTRSILVSSPVAFATQVVEQSYQWLFVKTGIAGLVEANAESVGWVGTLHTYLSAAIYVTLMTITRCVILVLTSPLFLLVALVGFVDGLVRRDLRRFGAGRESAFIYHHAKRLVNPIFIVGWLIYLSIPFSIHPNLFLLPCALLFGLMISIATSSFKKYL